MFGYGATTLGIKGLTLSITGCSALHYAVRCNAECRVLFTVMLSVIMLNVIMLTMSVEQRSVDKMSVDKMSVDRRL